MTKLTTHALDTYSGKPAKGMKVDVYFVSEKREKIKSVVLNNDGRPDEVLVETIKTGNYELVFHVGEYFKKIAELHDSLKYINKKYYVCRCLLSLRKGWFLASRDSLVNVFRVK